MTETRPQTDAPPDEKQSRHVDLTAYQQQFEQLCQPHPQSKWNRYRLPTKAELIVQTNFGRPDSNHSFLVEPCFQHILLLLFKSSFLDDNSSATVREVHPAHQHLFDMIDKTARLDFTRIASPMSGYEDQDEIPLGKVMCVLAAALHYDLHLPSVIRFAGGNYTGEYRDVDKIVKRLKGIVDEDDINDLRRLFTTGAPARMVAESSFDNFSNYFQYGNHKSISKDLTKVKKTMNKEERNNFVLPLPNWTARFIPNAFFTPNGLVTKPGKKDRLVFDGSFLINWDSQPINSMIDMATEPEVTYGRVLQDHINRIWNLRISYPNKDIFLWDDDVKSCFRHGKHHPDVMPAFGLIIDQLTYFYVGQTFGSVFSPANQEPIRRARAQLAQALFDDASLVAKHKSLLAKVQFDVEAVHGATLVAANPCSRNSGVLDSTGRPANTPLHTFVDDALMADTRDRIMRAMAASIEALYIILGFPDTEVRQDALSIDKFLEATCSPIKIQLGLKFDTRRMTLSLTDKYRDKMTKELTHWHDRRRSFTALQAARLVGTLQYMASISQWARFLFVSLSHSVIVALKGNKDKLEDSSAEFQRLSIDLREADRLNNAKKVAFIQAKISRMVWNKREKYHIVPTMRQELKIITKILSDHKRYRWESPIAHKAERDPDFTAYGDACLYGGGGFSTDLGFWWQQTWPEHIQKCTLLHLQDNRSGKFISINVLEYLVIIVNYAAVTCAHLEQKENGTNDTKFPLLLNMADNTSADSWTRKMCTTSKKGKALALVLASTMINNPVGLSSKYLSCELNDIADAISRIHKNDKMFDITTLMQTYPQLRSCRRFHPSPELLSKLYDAVSSASADPLDLPNKLGRFDLARTTI